uniref:DC1 domain-containing protein n=1 Tax=Oryza barthii TaxID=65489 RepID=A0A0D3GY21_9ORYZ
MAAADNLPAEVSHPRLGSGCTLTLVLHRHGDAATIFDCEGCREPGEGTRYTSGDLVLHTHCALAAPTLQHPLVKGDMVLRHVAPTGRDAVLCDACYGAVRGFHYHSSTSGLDLHPGCAKMPVSITLQEGGATFVLRRKVKHRCTSCRAMEGFYRPWCYRSKNTDQRMYLHVKCIKEIMAGLGHGGGSGEASKMHHHEIMAAGSSRRGADAGGEADDRVNRVIARLQERAGGGGSSKSKLVRRVCEVLLMLMRVVMGVLLGDPTAPLIAFNFIMP